MILSIERAWHKWPGWFATLDRPTQIRLIADHRLELEDPKRTEKRVRAARRAKFDKIRARANAQGTEPQR